MEQTEVAAIVAALRKEHPEMIEHLRALAACKDHPVAAHATPLMEFLLTQYDLAGARKWALRDLLVKRDKFNAQGQPDYYWALRHNAADMVRRIHAWAEIGDGKIEVPFTDKPHE